MSCADECIKKSLFTCWKKDDSVRTEDQSNQGEVEPYYAIRRSKYNKGRWGKDEHERFLVACFDHGEDWDKIERAIKTRSIAQIRSHAQKYLLKICKKYSIKLKTKKFKNKLSKHLDSVNKSSKGKLSIHSMNKYERNIFEMFKYYQREYEPGENQSNNKKEEAKMENSSSSRPSNEVQFALNAITREMSKSNANFYSETVGEIGDFLLRCSHTSYNEQYNKSFNSFLVYLENQNKLFDSLCSSLNYSSIATKFLQMPLRNDQMM